MDKALGLLALSRKGGNLGLGEEAVGAAARAGKARLIVCASDASDHSMRRVRNFVAGTHQPYITLSYSKDTLGDAVGIRSCAMAVILDTRLALAFVKALDEPERYRDLLADLTLRVKRIDQRRQEEKAHERNKKFGKKPQSK